MGWLLGSGSVTYKSRHQLFLSLMFTHGGQPSAKDVGDVQTYSNIEAGLLYGFYETYYQYLGEKLRIKLGLQDINTDFLVSETALLFAHSSAGLDPMAAINIPGPTYPFYSAAATAIIDWSTSTKTRLGIFDGRYAEPRNNFLPFDWKMNASEGFLLILEQELQFNKGKILLKPGVFYHTGNFVSRENGQTERGLWTIYQVSDFTLFKGETQSLSLYTQSSFSKPAVSNIKYYLGGGLRWSQPFQWKQDHQLGFCVAHANLPSVTEITEAPFLLDSETALELTFNVQAWPWLRVQPYVQWIMQDKAVPAAEIFTATLRAVAEF